MVYLWTFQVLHYAQELFEGMKAYRGVDDEIRYSLSYLFVNISSTVCLLLFPNFFYRLFRPMHNMTRMLVSAQRSCLPEFDRLELVHCIRKLIQVNIIFWGNFHKIDLTKIFVKSFSRNIIKVLAHCDLFLFWLCVRQPIAQMSSVVYLSNK